MMAWLEFGLSNALAASALAAVALAITRVARRPQLAFAAWMLVLAKLLVPPLVSVPMPSVRPVPEAAPLADVASHVPPALALLPEGDGLSGDLLSTEELMAPWTAEPSDAVPAPPPDPGGGAAIEAFDYAPQELDAAAFDVDYERAAPPPSLSATGLLIAVWLGVSACWLAIAVVRMARFGRVLSGARSAPQALVTEVEALAAQLGLRRAPRVKLARGHIPPLVWAMFGEPVILLPAGLLRALSPRQRTTLLVHELVHLRRRDHLARLVELAALCLYWWLPVAWWARRHAERAAEQCCDAEVVAHLPGAACAYAEALITTVDFLSDAPRPLPLGASGFSQAVHVKRRIEMILATRPPRRPLRSLQLILLAAGLVALPLSLRTLWAEPAEPADEPAQVAVADEAQQAETGETAQSDDEPDAAATSSETATPATSIEKRLDRMEKMIESLVAKVESRRGSADPPPPTAARMEQPRSSENDVWLAVAHELADLARQSSLNIELLKTNSKRMLAAENQYQAVKRAFNADTVDLDQLLEAQRRLVEAQLSHARTNCELCSDPERREYLLSVMTLGFVDKALYEARQTWLQQKAKNHGSSVESKAEAQAREQYHQFKSQAEELLKNFREAAVRRRETPPAELARRRDLGKARHFESQVTSEQEKLAEARQRLSEAREQIAAGQRAPENLRQLEAAVDEAQQRLIYRFEQLTAAVQPLLEKPTSTTY